ncbi:MAG: kelch repeat-containing protein, partial [Rhodothermales bacterium]
PRGGHTATLLPDGSILVTGGASRAGAAADGSAFLLEAGSVGFTTLPNGLLDARSGHTATRLPDGRVLIVGGSSIDAVDDLSNLVGTIEIFDPSTETFQRVPYEGEPIRRAFHTAALRMAGGLPVVDLFGGLGDVRYRPQPALGTRQDLQSFAFKNDSLISLSPAPGPLLDRPLHGHIQTAIESEQPTSYLVAGTDLTTFPREHVAFVLDYTAPQGLSQDETGGLLVERTRHAAENLRTGLIGVFGGRNDDSPALAGVELYVHSIGRFFRYPASDFALRRFGLTATKLPNERILLLGGFSPSGEALTATETFLAPPL